MGGPARILTRVDAVAIIVGIVIGAGIFRFPSLVAASLPSVPDVLAVWLAGGAISLIGALCYAELASAFPDAGGEFHFLTRAYGWRVGTLFVWARMTVIQSGSIALLAFVFGDYAVQLLPIGPNGAAVYAALLILALTFLNFTGARPTAAAQRLFFAVTLVGLVLLIGASLAGAPLSAAVEAVPPGPGLAGFGVAMILVLLTYGGWNEAAYISAEVKGGGHAFAWALIWGVGIVTVAYVAANAAFLYVLGLGGLARSQALAADIMGARLGTAGADAITVVILLFILDSVNVTLFTGARTNYAAGRDLAPLAFLGRWDERRATPWAGLGAQCLVALALVGLGTIDRRGVETLVDYVAPVFWLFFLLTGIAVFVLRRNEPDALRPFRIPLYPLEPIVFCLCAGYLLYASLSYTGIGALAGVIVLASGLPLLLFGKAGKGNAS